MPTIIASYILNALIAEGDGETTITELRDNQMAELDFDCPQCPGETPGLITHTDIETGITSLIPCPLCNGMGKTVVEYEQIIDSYHYAPVTPEP